MEEELLNDLDFDDNKPELSDFVTINTKKTCIGKMIYVYNLKKIIDSSFFDFVEKKYKFNLIYPLGEKYKYFSLDCQGNFVLTGILDTNEIKLVLKFSASLEVKSLFENLLLEYCQI